MKLRELIKKYTEVLGAAGVPDAGTDAKLLLFSAFGLDGGRYLLEKDREIMPEDEEKLERLRMLSKRRCSREPLQYLLGEAWFMGLRFRVDPSVLIPRADTETLVEKVLSDYPDRKVREELCVWDLCTGSGCIAVALSVLGGFRRVCASDLSGDALAAAEENAGDNGADIRFYQGDLFEVGVQPELCDILVSNPPYIRDGEIPGLQREVSEFEPRMALSGGTDGLLFYRRIIREAGRVLRRGGSIYLEIGYDQAEAVKRLLSEGGFRRIEVTKDLAGSDRVVSGHEYTGTNQ